MLELNDTRHSQIHTGRKNPAPALFSFIWRHPHPLCRGISQWICHCILVFLYVGENNVIIPLQWSGRHYSLSLYTQHKCIIISQAVTSLEMVGSSKFNWEEKAWIVMPQFFFAFAIFISYWGNYSQGSIMIFLDCKFLYCCKSKIINSMVSHIRKIRKIGFFWMKENFFSLKS